MKKKQDRTFRCYHVEFAIEVWSQSYNDACGRAWRLLSGAEGRLLPVGDVLMMDDPTGHKEQVDLQELADKKRKRAKP